MNASASELFRGEALEQHAQAGTRGSLLRISPTWTRWSYWLLVGVVVAGLGYAMLGTVNEYAMGPAIIRAQGREEVVARAPGSIVTVAVEPGQRVRAGDLLVRFHDADERAELDRIGREFDLQLIKLLRDPADQTARQSLTSLRAQKELALARFEERAVKASSAGIVSDVRVRTGQHLVAGDTILSLVPEASSYRVIAMLPGYYRPQLSKGMPLRVELEGYRYQYQQLTIEGVGEEVVGPNEVKRYLGPDIADAVPVTGPVVLVSAQLPSSTFLIDGRRFRFHDGMPARVDARVRSERLFIALVPGLRAMVTP